ncbi:hypothetical protein [Pyrodictium delaneyi]|uniref:TRASH domain-containing protein n=1 Tax=Pyrodictium delaneyi TaxID=1273541 RepID=A0A211YNC2_9CREN|nr:hypothetical protein [Pyrodictium delaneyi]OWJ54456.1 hypothetical protein Pdsh_07650 [Pyrodictium delaneyi]
MPFQLSTDRRVYRCTVCGRITTKPILYKTCCMNRPVVFCSKVCAEKWIREWMRRQEQFRRGGPLVRL